MSHTESKELTLAKKLIDVSKLDEAENVIKDFEEKGGKSLHDIVLCHLLKCELLRERGLFENVVKLAEETYKESLGLGKNLLSVDILLEMAFAILCLFQTDKAHNIIKQGEELLKSLTLEIPANYKQRKAYIALLKGWVYDQRGDVDRAIKQFELSLLLRKELGVKKEIANSHYGIAHIFMWKGDLDRALKHLEQGLVLAEESGNKTCKGGILYYMANLHYFKGELDQSIIYGEQSLTIFNDLNNKFMILRILNTLGGNYTMKGDLNRSIRFYEQSLEVFKEFNNKIIMANIYNSLSFCYKMKGELDRALECIELSMTLYRELRALRSLANSHDYLIQILIDRGDFERARISLRDLEQLNGELKYKTKNLLYRFNKALVLKTSSRALNRGKAEEIFKQLLEEKDLVYESRLMVLLNLCELLLADLQITNEAEVLEEIKPLIVQILDLSEKSHSFWVLGEAYLLQAKLALISLNLEEARRLLTQGQKIAEKFGLDLLAQKISIEHDELLKQENKWEKLKESKAPLAERIKTSRLNEQMERMVKNRIVSPSKLEVEQPISLIIITENGNPLLFNHFTADMEIDNNLLGEFLSSYNIYCDQIFSETFDRVKLGQYTVLINSVEDLFICYLFRGQTYSAQQKVKHFSEILNRNTHLIEIFKSAQNDGRIIQVENNPIIEELIIESFMSDPNEFRMPFTAYKGGEPYVFTSYAHTDKLEVYPIIDYLNKVGINIWYDEGIPVSENWKKSIAVNLERCSTFLVFITPHIIDSEYVRKEISFALKKKKKFIAVYLKETKLPTELEFEIADIQAIMKYILPKAEFLNKLQDILHKSTR